MVSLPLARERKCSSCFSLFQYASTCPSGDQNPKISLGSSSKRPSEWRIQSKSIRANTKSGRAGALFAEAGEPPAGGQVGGGGTSRTTRKPRGTAERAEA